MQIGDNPKQESEKVGFQVFAILRKKKKKKNQPEVAVVSRKVIWLHLGNLGYKVFECTTYGLGVMGGWCNLPGAPLLAGEK